MFDDEHAGRGAEMVVVFRDNFPLVIVQGVCYLEIDLSPDRLSEKR